MSRKQVTILIVLGAFIAIVAVLGVLKQQGVFSGISMMPTPGGEEPTGETPGGTGTPAIPETGFTPDVPQNAVPTTPDIEAPAAQNGTARFGAFDMKVSRSGFAPSSITVKLGDIVQINLTAEGGDFDFSMPWSGLYQSVRAGETKQISFQTTAAGTYEFKCSDFCPPGGLIGGTIIVTP